MPINDNQSDEAVNATNLVGEEPVEALAQDDEIPESQDVSEEGAETPQGFRSARVRDIPSGPGVYALCDLDGVPLYVGQSVDGIQARVRRHLTSARSDIIANRMVDIWEVASVQCWEVRPPRLSFTKHRDSQVDAESWKAETLKAVEKLEEQKAGAIEAFESGLQADLRYREKRTLVAKVREDLNANISDYKKQRGEQLKERQRQFSANNKEAWTSTRKAETRELKALTDPLESYLYNEFNSKKLLMNAKALDGVPTKPAGIPEPATVIVMQDDTRKMRRIKSLRLSRQASHFNSLLDHILNVKNNPILRVALKAHYYRLSEYCEEFVGEGTEVATLNK